MGYDAAAGVECTLAEAKHAAWVADLQGRSHSGRRMRAAELAEHLGQVGDRRAAVARSGGLWLGYLLYRDGSRPELLDLAVEPDCRRLGVATHLLLPLLNARPRVTAVVRETCLPGQLLLRSLGFRCTRVHKRRYRLPPADGYFFMRDAGATP